MHQFFAEWGFALNLLLGYLHSRRQGQLLLKNSASQGCPHSILLLPLSLSQPLTDFQSHYLWMGSKLQPTFTATVILSCPAYSFSYCKLFNTWMSCFVRSGPKKAWFAMDLCPVYPAPFLPKSPTTATPTLYHETPHSASTLISPFILSGLHQIPSSFSHFSHPSLLFQQEGKPLFFEKEVKLCNPETL